MTDPPESIGVVELDEEDEVPEWLGELPEAPDTSLLRDPMDLTDVPETDLELEMPDGLAGPLEDKEAPVSPEFAGDMETGLPIEGEEVTITLPDVSETTETDDIVMPDWLGESPEALQEEPAVSLPEASETRQKTGLTGLLNNLREQNKESEPSTELAEVGSETDLPELIQAAPGGEAETPDWLANASPEEVAQILAELESLSDEEAQRLLDEELQQGDD